MNKIVCYNSIEILPLYNFDKYRNTNDFNWFIIGYDGRQKKIANKELKEIETNIIDEYFKALDDRSFSIRLQKWAEIDVLKLKYNICVSLIERIWIGFGNNEIEKRHIFITELGKQGFKMPIMNDLYGDREHLIRVRTGVEGLKTKISLIEIELKKDEKKESVSLARQLQIATLGLQYPYRLNSKEITVSEWIEITKLLQEKSKLN